MKRGPLASGRGARRAASQSQDAFPLSVVADASLVSLVRREGGLPAKIDDSGLSSILDHALAGHLSGVKVA